MANYELDPEEVILDEKNVNTSVAKGTCTVKGTLKMTLTSKKIILEKQKGILKKKELELIGILPLDELKYFNGEPQIKQKMSDVTVQTVGLNCTLTFANPIEAKIFVEKVKDAATGTTVVDRGSSMAKGAFNVVDDILGLDTRETIKGVVQSGLKGALWNGIGKK